MRWQLLIIVFIVAGTGLIFAQNNPDILPDEDTLFWSVQVENDYFARSGDRYYTHGTQISCLKPGRPPRWLGWLASMLPPFNDGGDVGAVNYTFGQNIFTPENTQTTALIEDDRPYAGFMYLSAMMLAPMESNEFIRGGAGLELTVGIVGPASRAAETQSWFHEEIGIDQPQGWDNQLTDEFILNLTATRIWSIVQPIRGNLEYAIGPHISAALGNAYTYAAGGVMFRLGMDLESDFSPPGVKPGFPGLPFFGQGAQRNWYFFVGHETRLVYHNIFLDGNTFSDSHSVEKEFLVGDFQIGLVVHLGQVRLAVSQMIRSKEFIGQDDETRYGAINVSWYF